MEFDLQNPLTGFEEYHFDAVSALFANESDHMPSFLDFKSTDVRFSLRRHSVFLISQVQSSYKFDGYIAYLAVNYIDRFLSKQAVLENKPWIVRILVIVSLSLAAKMRNVDLSLSDIQRDVGLNFDARSIHRMESLILDTLKWRLRSITPFSFLHFFNSFLKLGDSSLTRSLKQRASDIIFSTQYEIKLFVYKPSIIAASALLRAAEELIPLQYSSCLAAISENQYSNKELMNALAVMREMPIEGREYCSKLTPKSVLECEHTSSQCETQDKDNIKKRRLSDIRDDQTFQISQVQWC
ncbi:putative cyclin-D6-1 isoform X2 [Solanum lycopersicum]|uniref:putative cyclin-D6-1 isoform X2 n=1 Tax=Solanum lycopersicum TaxID=4081 RepID=UPI000532BDA6|nr:putative cyclin-D6-1 isoform X2 [Solanum lycopersicum]